MFIAIRNMIIFLAIMILSNQNYFNCQQTTKQIIEGESCIEGQICVIKKTNYSFEMMEDVFHKYGATIVRNTESIGLSLIQVTKGTNIFEIIEALQNEPSVEFAEPNYILRASFNPNDPHFSSGKQWGLNNVGQIPPGGTTDADIDAPEAWDITQGSSYIKIAILDSGIPLINGSLSHEDLNNVNRIELGPDFVYGTFGLTDSDPTIKDLAGHGTHVTGIVGAETNNSLGIAGIAPNCKILSIQVGDANIATTTEVMANGIIAAVNLGANIINISYGSYFPTTAVEVAIYNVALPANVIIVSSTGNENGGVFYPARYSSVGSIPSYPNGYPNVIAVGATNEFDERSSYSNFGFALNVVAPGGYGGTFDENDIFSTLPNYPIPNLPLNYGYAAGTSMSAPVVAGIAALILSVNPNLTPGQVREIIQQTADDKGTIGRDDYYGWGRVNAFQAVLSSLALINKSGNYDATSHNNNHILERGYFGKLHKVFISGGEIFYRMSSNNGTSWEITKRITSGNSSNYHPSIVAGVSSTDVLRLVWQRKLDDTHYEIWYSYSNNSGTDWSTPAIVPGCTNVTIQYYQSNPGAGPGPTPVVSSFWRGGAEGTPCFLLVYADQNGLRYRFANDNNLSWSIPANDIVPGSNLSSIVWYPCLTSYNSQGFNVNLIYDDRFTHVYSQIYNEDGTWTNRVIADGVGTYNRMSSVALDYTNNPLGVWSGWNGSNYVIRFRQGFANGTWSSWSKEWSVSGVNSFCPVATYYNKGGAYPYGIDILWFTSSNQIRQKKYYGLGDNWIPADPNTQLLYSNGLFPNITHERQNTTIPKQIHTDQTTQPYSLMDNSLNLPKENLMVGGANYRAAEITDSLTNSNFRIELKEPVITLTTGEKIVLPFKEYNYHDTLALSTENVFTYLQTKLYGIPNTAQSITFKINIVASQPDTNSSGILNTNKATPFKNVVFKLLAKDNSLNTLLNNIGYVTLNNSSGIYQHSKEFTINIQELRNKNIFIIPNISISGSFNQNALLFSLVNISVEENSIAKDSTEIVKSAVKPTEYILEQNYPNPFNPVTQIKYSIVDNGIVTLKIYDILGREIVTLVNEEKTTGNYEVGFDASNLSSGIYLYTLSTTGGGGSFIQTRKMVLLK